MLIDLNSFKEINDTLGHQTGDQVLMELGPRLAPVVSGLDGLVARLGGDEFAVLLYGLTGEHSITEVADQLLESLKAPFDLDGLSLHIRASLGIARYPEHGKDPGSLLRCADVAMYIAKEAASGHAFYQAERDRHSPTRLALLSDLHTAIGENQLRLHYQPKVNAATQQLIGFEALVRWEHPQLGMIPPGRFVPLAELGETIRPMTYWVLENAIHQGTEWLRQELDVVVSANISTRNLMDEAFVDRLDALLTKYGLPPDRLELEVTESAFIHDPERALSNLESIHALGVQLAIDDFGTGYSSMAYLKRMPIHTLKIDMTFVRQMASNPEDQLIVRSAILLAQSFGLVVVAEGVEDEQTLRLLCEMGCDHAQGYHISEPVPPESIDTWLTRPPGIRFPLGDSP